MSNRTNVIPNPSFEVNVSGWNSGGGRLTLTRWTDGTAKAGTYYARATANVAIGTSSGYIYPASQPASGGQPWSAACWVRPSVTANYKIQIRGAAAGSYVTPYIEGPAISCPAGVWTKLTASGVLPSGLGIDSVTPLLFCLPAMALNAYFEVDAYQLVQEATPGPYIEGQVIIPELVATVLPELAAVRLQLLDVEDGPAVITRTDHNGSAPVRLLPNQSVQGGSLIAVDYEPAIFGPVTYRAVDAIEDVAEAAPVQLDGTPPTVASVAKPQLRAATLVLDLAETNTDNGTEHTVLDDDAPLVVIAAPSTRRVTVTAWAATYAEAAELREVLTARQVVMVRYADYIGADVYGTPRRVSVSPERSSTTDPASGELARRWIVTFELSEERRPGGPLLSAAGWTFDVVTATYDDFNDLALAFPTFDAMTVGP